MTRTDGKYINTYTRTPNTHTHTHAHSRLLCILLLWQQNSDSRANDGCLNLFEKREQRGEERRESHRDETTEQMRNFKK